jgi:hypothetical protein
MQEEQFRARVLINGREVQWPLGMPELHPATDSSPARVVVRDAAGVEVRVFEAEPGEPEQGVEHLLARAEHFSRALQRRREEIERAARERFAKEQKRLHDAEQSGRSAAPRPDASAPAAAPAADAGSTPSTAAASQEDDLFLAPAPEGTQPGAGDDARSASGTPPGEAPGSGPESAPLPFLPTLSPPPRPKREKKQGKGKPPKVRPSLLILLVGVLATVVLTLPGKDDVTTVAQVNTPGKSKAEEMKQKEREKRGQEKKAAEPDVSYEYTVPGELLAESLPPDLFEAEPAWDYAESLSREPNWAMSKAALGRVKQEPIRESPIALSVRMGRQGAPINDVPVIVNGKEDRWIGTLEVFSLSRLDAQFRLVAWQPGNVNNVIDLWFAQPPGTPVRQYVERAYLYRMGTKSEILKGASDGARADGKWDVVQSRRACEPEPGAPRSGPRCNLSDIDISATLTFAPRDGTRLVVEVPTVRMIGLHVTGKMRPYF